MAMLRTGVREMHSALYAQTRAIRAAQRCERQGKHHGIAERRLEIEQFPLQETPVRVVAGQGRRALRFIQFAEGDFDR